MSALDHLQQDEAVLAQQSETSLVLFHLDSGNYYSLNELGSRVWSLCDGTHTFSQITAILASEYDAPPEVIEEDCQSLAASLLEKRLLVRSTQHGSA